jgi:hypothetical protein
MAQRRSVLIKTLVIASSLLLAGGFIAHRSGALARFASKPEAANTAAGASNPPSRWTNPVSPPPAPAHPLTPAQEEEILKTIMGGSKTFSDFSSYELLKPTEPVSPEVERIMILPGSKSGIGIVQPSELSAPLDVTKPQTPASPP